MFKLTIGDITRFFSAGGENTGRYAKFSEVLLLLSGIEIGSPAAGIEPRAEGPLTVVVFAPFSFFDAKNLICLSTLKISKHDQYKCKIKNN